MKRYLDLIENYTLNQTPRATDEKKADRGQTHYHQLTLSLYSIYELIVYFLLSAGPRFSEDHKAWSPSSDGSSLARSSILWSSLDPGPGAASTWLTSRAKCRQQESGDFLGRILIRLVFIGKCRLKTCKMSLSIYWVNCPFCVDPLKFYVNLTKMWNVDNILLMFAHFSFIQ